MPKEDTEVVTALKKYLSPSGNLHDHLIDVFANIELLHPKVNGLEHFERVSEYFKNVRFNPSE